MFLNTQCWQSVDLEIFNSVFTFMLINGPMELLGEDRQQCSYCQYQFQLVAEVPAHIGYHHELSWCLPCPSGQSS